MASPCEVIIDSQDPLLCESIFKEIQTEALRIEQKYSRYRDDNIVHQINTGKEQFIALDPETSDLMDFAKTCYQLSGGLFDITSGVLRKIWNFKNFSEFPDPALIQTTLSRVGFDQLKWDRPHLKLKKGMEIDFGGIVKEYAVDRALTIAKDKTNAAILVNFGGDLAINKKPRSGSWSVAIEEGFKRNFRGSQLELSQGALATSGDTHRFFEYQGQRYSHILNPKTGIPVANGIASITVHAATCTLAGMIATMSHLQDDPKSFLETQDVQHWIVYHDPVSH